MDLDKLSAERKWDEVFHCLKIDVNSTIELGSIKVSRDNKNTDKWLDEYKGTMSSLEVILAIILFFDQIFYLFLLWYLICFTIKFIRYRGVSTCWQWAQKIYSLEEKIKVPVVTKKKTISFAKGTFEYYK